MVVDTGIFIDHFRAKDKPTTDLFKLSKSHKLSISSVTLYELYIGAQTKDKEIDIKFLIEGLAILPFTDKEAIKAAQIYGELKKNNQLIEFSNIFIAAACIVNELPVVTLNKKAFSKN